jgi:hypothetical protein
MISFGDFQKGKLVKGQNPLAEGLGVCLFDSVSIFLDKAQEVTDVLSSGQKKNGKQNLGHGQKGGILP